MEVMQMKRFLINTLLILAVATAAVGCSGNNGDNGTEATTETEISTTESDFDRSEDIQELSDKISDLVARAEPLQNQGKLDEDKYLAVVNLQVQCGALRDIKNSEEFELQYNSILTSLERLTYDVSAAEDPDKTDSETAIKSLMSCITELEPTLTEANSAGRFPSDRLEDFNAYKAEVQGYADGTSQPVDGRLEEIRSDIGTMASQAEASNEVIDKINGSPVSVEDNNEVDEFVTNSSALLKEFDTKYTSGEVSEEVYLEFLQTAVNVAKVNEAIDTGTITDETRQLMKDTKAELKKYAQSIGSDLADKF
jgi:hypothetical protein